MGGLIISAAAAVAFASGQAGAALSGQTATSTDTTFTYAFNWTGSNVARRDAFIDADRNIETGFAIGGIYAEYLLQDGTLYQFTGPTPTSWGWSPVAGAVVTFSAGSPAQWTFNRSNIGETCSDAASVVFRTEDSAGNTIDIAPAFSHDYLANPSCVRLGMASYLALGSPDWSAVELNSKEVGFAVVNPASGPGPSRSQGWDDEMARLRNGGIAVYGYIKSRQAGVPSRARQDVDYVTDIDRWYIWYGPRLNGIFIDEEYNTCTSNLGPNGETNFNEAQYYKNIVHYVKQSRNAYAPTGGVKVILNPGGLTDICMFQVNDTPNPAQDIIQANFEGTATKYSSFSLPAGRWEYGYPASQFWHLVYSAYSPIDVQNVVAHTRSPSLHAGNVYVIDTDAGGCAGVGTWNLLPGVCRNSSSYWTTELQVTDN